MSKVKNISILNFVPQGRGRENKEELKEFSEILSFFSIKEENYYGQSSKSKRSRRFYT